ncbi:dimethylhistidine N-methyltransferase [Bryocella elongata]|uniref:Dimethylhistidine N-methyltransferase n=1 Tax=Bryocella elongata TaxID=863522 RepID=A0A1H5UXX4_9BACT|nr:L-histidine N(alpha)-methyltransferase [Bryocella elongata]SEF79824.1 dimethylhistidine N-methyltransferase [Bryocella elongata]
MNNAYTARTTYPPTLPALSNFPDSGAFVRVDPSQEGTPPAPRDVASQLAMEVRNGLQSRPRSLKPWMLYDEAGSHLFEQITSLPEYYPTRTERTLLAGHADAILSSVFDGPQPLRIVELGAGSAAKTCMLLSAAARKNIDVIYMPLDVSAEALEMACSNVESAFPHVLLEPLVVNYVDTPPQLEPFDGRTLALYLGTSIGNFTPKESQPILRNLAAQLDHGDALLLGTDLVKEEPTLIAAYDDCQGVTAAFNLNILNRLNRELDADFDLMGFRHRALWNPLESRMEMHLESLRRQTVSVRQLGLELDFLRGETIHTENSYKFTDQTLGDLLSAAGFQIETTWKDPRRWYALTLNRRCKWDRLD